MTITPDVIESTEWVFSPELVLLSEEFLMSSYVTLADMRNYLLGVLESQAWDEASSTKRQKALIMATRAIDRLDFQGEKADEDQELQFPRGDDVNVPQDIKDACCALALAFLDGVDPEQELDSLRLKSQGYATARATYDSEFVPEYIRAGIPSKTAWNYLKPYLRDIEQLTVARTD